MITRRTAAKGGLFGLATALSGIATGMAKDNKPGGFGATASVSVNSGNNSGNQTFQENQAILTENAAGQITIQQGNAASGGSVQQGSVQTSSAIEPVTGVCRYVDFSPCTVVSFCQPDGSKIELIPLRCAADVANRAGCGA